MASITRLPSLLAPLAHGEVILPCEGPVMSGRTEPPCGPLLQPGQNPLSDDPHDDAWSQEWLDVPGASGENLYSHFAPLLVALLRQYGTTSELRRDLRGEIYYQFHRLVDSYSLEHGVPLADYVTYQLSQAVSNYVRTWWSDAGQFVSQQQLEVSHEAAPSLPLSDPANATGLSAAEVRKLPQGVLASLPHRQRLVVVWRFYEERSIEQIAADLGIPPAAARSLLDQATSTLRRHQA